MKALLAAVLALACVAGSTNGFARGGAAGFAHGGGGLAHRSAPFFAEPAQQMPPSKAGFPPRSRLPSRPPSSTARCRSPPSAACNGSAGLILRRPGIAPLAAWFVAAATLLPARRRVRCRRRALAGGESARTDVRVDRRAHVIVLDASVTRARKPGVSITSANMIFRFIRSLRFSQTGDLVSRVHLR